MYLSLLLTDLFPRAFVTPQVAQARSINYRVSRYCFAYSERVIDFVWKISYTLLTRRNIGIDIEIYFTFVNVRLLLLFLCNLGSIHGHFIRFCGSLLVRCCFPKLCEARQVTVCILNWQISPESKNRTPIRHESAESLRPGESLIISPHRGYCDVFFFVWKLFESFRFWAIWRALRKLDDHQLRDDREHFKYAHPRG